MSQRVLENRTLQVTQVRLQNITDSRPLDNLDVNTDIYSKVLVTLIYAVLFVIDLMGNSMTLYISLNRRAIKPIQGTIHYHLASLAVSDLFILILCRLSCTTLYGFIIPGLSGSSAAEAITFCETAARMRRLST